MKIMLLFKVSMQTQYQIISSIQNIVNKRTNSKDEAINAYAELFPFFNPALCCWKKEKFSGREYAQLRW